MRLFIKKFLLHPAQQSIRRRRRRRSGLRSKNLFAPCRHHHHHHRFLSRDIALQYYIILRGHVEFRLFGFNERDSTDDCTADGAPCTRGRVCESHPSANTATIASLLIVAYHCANRYLPFFLSSIENRSNAIGYPNSRITILRS